MSSWRIPDADSSIVEAEMVEKAKTLEETIPQGLLWLCDAPMFIDAKYIARFYDAVVMPANEEGPSRYKVTEELAKKAGGKLGAKVSLGLGPLLSFLGLGSANAEMAGEISDEKGERKGEEQELTLKPIHTPQRQLLQLTAHYLLTCPERFFYVEDVNKRDQTGDSRWWEASVIARAPRALAFINLPSRQEAEKQSAPRTMLIPVAAEFTNGSIVTYFDKVRSKPGQPTAPAHPDFDNLGTYEQDKKAYWKWYSENFEIQSAIDLIEQSVKDQGCRIQWIDFRVPISNDGESLHLHIVGGGKFDTITFAYNFIRRGHEFGIRLIGTLKSDPDLNVIAIYER